jgi:tetratricopeptide (TPR) repeat protein
MPKAIAQPNETHTPRLSPTELMELLKSQYQAADQVRRGVCLLNAGRYDEAAAAFSGARQLGSTDRSLPSYIAGCLVGQGRVDEAALQWARRVEEAPSDSVSRIRHAQALWTAGKAGLAIESLRSAVRDDPECAELHFQLGTMLAATERFDEAELRFTQALTIDRDQAEALISLALCCGARGAASEAVSYLQRAQVRRPHDARIGLLLAEAAKAMQQQGLAVRVRANIAEVDVSEDRRGIEELSRLIEADPDFVDAFLSIPAGEVDERVFAMLLSTLEVALERQPEHAELHFHCGRILDRLGRRDDAIGANERAVDIDPTFTRALIELGKLYRDTDRTEDATARLEQAIVAGAEYADVYYLLGNLYRDQGQVGRARSAYRSALAINNRYEAAQQALAALST